MKKKPLQDEMAGLRYTFDPRVSCKSKISTTLYLHFPGRTTDVPLEERSASPETTATPQRHKAKVGGEAENNFIG